MHKVQGSFKSECASKQSDKSFSFLIEETFKSSGVYILKLEMWPRSGIDAIKYHT